MSTSQSFFQLAYVRKNPRLLRFWSDVETFFLGKKIDRDIQSPIFVCGLARSGTTLITHILNTHRQTGSFLYRDLPFIEVPYFWHFVSRVYYGNPSPVKREHGDQLFINPDSPDAFEELLWKNAISEYDREGFSRFLDEQYSNPEFEKTLRTAINKLLFTRGKKTRYLSKGNYNLFRLRYLLKVFPDARIILCVRDPFSHAHSLARVHAKFTELSKQDKYFAKRLDILGHHEFGPLRKAIRLEGGQYERTLQHWEKGEDYLGYLLQWNDIYGFARKAYGETRNILWLDSKSMLTDKNGTTKKILQFCALPEDEIDWGRALGVVKDSTSYPPAETPYDSELKLTYQTLLELCA